MRELLFLAHRLPFPPDRGDKIRSYHVLRHLAQKARVHLVAFADEAIDREAPADLTRFPASCRIIPRRKARGRAAIEALVTGRPVSLAAFADRAMTAAVAETLAEHPIDGIYAFSGQMAQYLPTNGPPAIMDFVDVDSAKFAGYATRARGTMRWLMAREARLLGAYERTISHRVSASLFVSEAEADLFRAGGSVGVVRVVENGVDAAWFDPARDVPTIPGEGPLIVFTGQMDYAPNIEAVTGFVRDVLPAIRLRHPTSRFAIVGRAPTPAVRGLAGGGVIVTGTVDDTRGWMAAADVCVAPLAIARGIQNKVLEAMAAARPVVASTAAAEGIDHGGTIGVGDGANGIADAVIAILDDPWAAATLGQAARERVIARYGWAARLEPLDTLLDLP